MDSLDEIRDKYRDAAKQAIGSLEASLQRARENRDRLRTAVLHNEAVIARSSVTVQAIEALYHAGPNMSSYPSAREVAYHLGSNATAQRENTRRSLQEALEEVNRLERELQAVQAFLDWSTENS